MLLVMTRCLLDECREEDEGTFKAADAMALSLDGVASASFRRSAIEDWKGGRDAALGAYREPIRPLIMRSSCMSAVSPLPFANYPRAFQLHLPHEKLLTGSDRVTGTPPRILQLLLTGEAAETFQTRIQRLRAPPRLLAGQDRASYANPSRRRSDASLFPCFV